MSCRENHLETESETNTKPAFGEQQFLATLEKASRSGTAGEVIVSSGERNARIYFSPTGRIGWVVIPSMKTSFGADLVSAGLVDAATLRAVFEDCKQTSRNFFDTLVEWQLIAPEVMQKEFDRYVADCFVEILAWTDIKSMYVANKLTSTSGFSIALHSALANRQNTAKAEEPATHLKLVTDKTPDKEKMMDRVSKLKQGIELARENLGSGLLATDIFSAEDGQSIAGYNSQPRACALFARITADLQKTLSGANFPILSRYYILDLTDDKLVVVALLGDYSWGLLVDQTKVKMGLLLNVVLPDCLAIFTDALGDR